MEHWIGSVRLPEERIDLRSPARTMVRRQRFLTGELRRELGSDHSLSAIPWRLIAARASQDDVLLELDDGRVAITHLTFSKTSPEPSPWPVTQILESEAALTAAFEMRY